MLVRNRRPPKWRVSNKIPGNRPNRLRTKSWWEFRPRKKKLVPPPNSPQTPFRPLAPTRLEDPLLGFSIKNHPAAPPLPRLGLSLPLPRAEKHIKYPKRPPRNAGSMHVKRLDPEKTRTLLVPELFQTSSMTRTSSSV